MNKQSRKFVRIGLVAAAVIVVAVFLAFYALHKEHENNKQVVYAVLPLTGNIAEAGSHYKKTMDLYIEKHPATSIDIAFVDSGFDAAKANSAVMQKTIGAQRPIIITAITAISEALLPTIRNLGGFQIGISTLEAPSQKGFQTLQRISTTSLDGIVPLAKHAADNNRSISILYSQNDYGLSVRDFVKQQCKKQGVEILAEIDYSLANPDVRQNVLNALGHSAVDAVFVCGASTPAYINIFKELEILGFKGKVYADGVFTVPTVMNAVGKAIQQKTIFPCFDCLLAKPKTAKGIEFRQSCLNYGLSPYFVVVETYVALSAIDELVQKDLPINLESFLSLNQFETVVDVDFSQIGNAKFQYLLATVNQDGEVVSVQ